MNIAKYRNQLYWCSKCGYCRDTISDELGFYKVCPVYEVKRMEHYGPRGRATIALAVLESALQPSQALVDVVYSCLGCGICKAICPSAIDEGVDVANIMRVMRGDLLKMGLKPPEPIRQIDSNVSEMSNVFGEDSQRRNDWSKDLDLPTTSDTLYFAGCYTSYRYPETGRATVKILAEAGLEVSYLGSREPCCGVPQLWDGNIELARELAHKNVDAIRASGAKRVLTSCAGCYHTLKTSYKELLRELPYEAVHVSQLMLDLAKKGKLKMTKSVEGTFTYHDPCHLGRHEKVYEEPRELIKRVPKVQYREMRRNRRSAWCCGGGAVESAISPELTREVSTMRIADAREVGADAVVTSCPLCLTVLNRVAKPENMRVYDLPVIMAESMGIQI